jgi:hypothetical protein
MARSNLTEEERNDRFIQSMVVSTKQVKSVMVPLAERGFGSGKVLEETGREWYEFRSVRPDPNGSKYLGVPLLAPPSLNTRQIFEMLRVIFPEVRMEYYDSYTQDTAMGNRAQIIFDNYQFLTPRDAKMIEASLFTTLSFHNKLIELFRNPVTGKLSEDVFG